MSGFLISLPIPPSVNGMYANRKGGRYRTKKYEAWISEAGWELLRQRPRPLVGPYAVRISIPPTRGDPDNRAKAILDLLVKHKLTADDRHCRHVSVTVLSGMAKGFAVVSVEPAHQEVAA